MLFTPVRVCAAERSATPVGWRPAREATVPPEYATKLPELAVTNFATLSAPRSTMEGARIPLVTAEAAATPKMFVEVSSSLEPSRPLTSYTARTP